MNAIPDDLRAAMAVYTRKLGAPGARWDYHDAQGQRVGIVLRWDTDKGKEIRPISLIEGQWRCTGMPEPRVMYRLPRVLGSDGVVLVCEGEKAADAAIACGYTATTSPHGSKSARKCDWSPLRDRDVVIVPDLDRAGDSYARQVQQQLVGIARSVRVINLRDGWATLCDGGDLDDALQMCDGDAERLRAVVDGLVECAPCVQSQLVQAAGEEGFDRDVGSLDFDERILSDVRWLVDGRIAMGKVNMLAGDPGLGKSFISLELAARISRGEIGALPDGSPGRTVILSAEDDPDDTILPRLIAMNANRSRVRMFQGFLDNDGYPIFPELDRDANDFGRWIVSMGDVSLIVIDPISAYMGEVDSHKNTDVRRVLGKLSQIAYDTGAAVLCVSHLTKDSGSGKKAIYRTMGSLAFTAAARTVQLVTKYEHHSNDPEARNKRVVSMVKNNLGPMLPAMAYTIDDGRLVWLDEEIPGDADVFANGHAEFVSGETKGDRAVEFLERMLGSGAKAAREVFERGAAQGLAKSVLKDAKVHMGVVSYKRGRVWYWSRDGQDDTMLIRDAVEPELVEPPQDLGGHGEFGTY